MFVKVSPKGGPAGGGQQKGAQSDHRLGTGASPLHATAAETRCDQGFAGGFGHAAAEGPEPAASPEPAEWAEGLMGNAIARNTAEFMRSMLWVK